MVLSSEELSLEDVAGVEDSCDDTGALLLLEGAEVAVLEVLLLVDDEALLLVDAFELVEDSSLLVVV